MKNDCHRINMIKAEKMFEKQIVKLVVSIILFKTLIMTLCF